MDAPARRRSAVTRRGDAGRENYSGRLVHEEDPGAHPDQREAHSEAGDEQPFVARPIARRRWVAALGGAQLPVIRETHHIHGGAYCWRRWRATAKPATPIRAIKAASRPPPDMAGAGAAMFWQMPGLGGRLQGRQPQVPRA